MTNAKPRKEPSSLLARFTLNTFPVLEHRANMVNKSSSSGLPSNGKFLTQILHDPIAFPVFVIDVAFSTVIQRPPIVDLLYSLMASFTLCASSNCTRHMPFNFVAGYPNLFLTHTMFPQSRKCAWTSVATVLKGMPLTSISCPPTTPKGAVTFAADGVPRARTAVAGRFVSDAPSPSLSESDDDSLDESEEELLEEDRRGRDVGGTFGAVCPVGVGSTSLSSDESEEELLEEDERGRDVGGTFDAVCPVGVGSTSLSSDESEEELLEEDGRGRDVGGPDTSSSSLSEEEEEELLELPSRWTRWTRAVSPGGKASIFFFFAAQS